MTAAREIEDKFAQLTRHAQIELLARLVRLLGNSPEQDRKRREAELAAMAEDPEIQRELV